ncbi:MAG: PEGA domain-containing protein [Lentisphaerae bacterium]|nr:PEGA domain-containing protein [Lentisphaerota bacterium]
MQSTYHLQFMLLLAGTLLGSSCSLFMPWHEDIVVETEPPGAEVIIEGRKHLSPLRLSVRKDSTFSIYVHKDGFRGQNAWCGRQLSPTGILDLVGTCAFYVPAVGFISPAVWRHQQNYFFFKLQPLDDCCGHCQEQRENKTTGK